MDCSAHKMAGEIVLWSISLQILYFSNIILGFNLDTSIPIVKTGKTASYFGFSVTQHQKYIETTGNVEHLILVGAPRDNVTDTTLPPGVRRLKRPGVVYSCPVSTSKFDCTALKLETEDPLDDEYKHDQWMGVTVRSQGTRDGNAVACAHRYSKTVGTSSHWGLGICTTILNTLEPDKFLEPCEGLPEIDPKIKIHAYGLCQAGTAAAVNEDGDVLVGTPGPYNWRGAVMKNTIGRRGRGLPDKKWYRSPVNKNPATGYYSYLGMSSTIGKIIEGQTTYIGGAPRSLDIGQVFLFRQSTNNNTLSFEPRHVLTGEQFGSCFGYDVATIDLNNDGFEDLVVGAPFYHETGIGGAIYVYENGAKGITSESKPIKITSDKRGNPECYQINCEHARFGFSLASIGDMDRDGYSDLAVGAPYEDQGVVYIYRGSAKGIVRKYSQRIDASVMLSARPLSTFGYSLSGGIDMDSNGYPDLVVGAYGSDKVLILRSRPVVNVTASMISNPNLIDPKVTRCITDGTPYNCFSIRVCFRFKADPPDRFSRKMDLQFKLEAEKFTGQKIVRVFFESGSSHILEKTIKMNEQSNPQPKCRSYGVKIKRQNKDFLNPIMFRLTYKLPDKPPPTSSGGRLPNINNYPILNEAAAQEDLEVHFQKNCGTDKVCHSDLEIRAELGGLDVDNEGNAVLKVGQVNTISLIVTVVNRKEDAHYTTLNVTIPDSLSYVGTRSDRRQYSCTPGNHTILCLLGNPMSQNQVASFTIILDAKEIRPFVSTLDFALRVNTTSTEVNPGNNAMFLRANVIVEADMYLQSNSDPNEVFYGGKVRGESAITYEDEIGPQVVHSYEVKNSGPGKVVNSTVVISWPYEVEWGYPQGKHVLYLMQEPEVDAPGKCVLKPNMVNPLGIQEIAKFRLEKAEKRPRAQQETDIISYNASEPRSRRRRATVETVQDSGSVKQYRVITLDCRRRTAKCFKIRCHIGEMRSDQSVLIRLRARLWNSTFLEDYRKIDYVRIWSRAEISIDKRLNIRQPDVSNDVAICETKAIPDIQIVEGPGVPLWVIIVAAIAGILLLLVIVLALWKCGFFKRKKPEDMRRHKGKVEKKKNSYYEDGDY